MLSNKVAVALLGLLALVGAAGAGAFFASRPSASPMTTADVKAPAVQDSAPTKAVESTEAVVDDKTAAPEAPPAVETPSPAPAEPPAAPARSAPRVRRDSTPVTAR